MWSKSRMLLLLFIFFLVSFCVPAKRSSVTTPEAKLNQISDLASKSKSNVITLDDSNYGHYAISKPRPYSLAVFLTASHPKFKCAICKQLEKEYQSLAQSYAMNLGKNNTAKIFFLRLDYESSSKVFESYDVNSVPILLYMDPHLGHHKVHNEFRIDPRNKFQVEANPTAEALSSFIRERSGINITIRRSMLTLYLSLGIAFVVIGASIQPIINSLPQMLKIIQSKALWMFITLAVYTCAISGLIFDIIRAPQMYYSNPQTGQIMFFYPQSSSQFVVEGFIIGFLNLVCAGSLLFMAIVAVKFKSEQNRTLGTMTGCIVFMLCFAQIQSLYNMKNRWQ